MTTDNLYAVSVQWGAGFHYFTKSGVSHNVAERELRDTIEKLKGQRKRIPRGAKPKVRLWKLEDEEQLG